MTRRIELTIKTSYVPNWGTAEGIRELVQNGRDAQVELSAPLTVGWSAANGGTLRITNEGATLPLGALLMGHTTKADREDLVGQFGEGLDLGILALLRAGHTVRIVNGAEVWKPALEASKVFDAEVIAFYIQKATKDNNSVQFQVSGIDKAFWKILKPRFRCLDNKTGKAEAVETQKGTLLLGRGESGRIYSKGIWVETLSGYKYGYDLRYARTDRDRKMVNHWDLQWETAKVWGLALAQRPDLLDPFYTLLCDGSTPKDLEGFAGYNYLEEEDSARIAKKFAIQFGERAVPVSSLAESRAVEHLSAIGIVAPEALRKVLESSIGTVETVAAKLSNETVQCYSWDELGEAAQAILIAAVDLVSQVPGTECNLDVVDVVDFRSANIKGLYKEGRIQIARKQLQSRKTCLRTLVHEVAHHVEASAADGTWTHVRAIERIWSEICEIALEDR